MTEDPPKCRVLVVEDDQGSREVLVEFLKIEGYSVVGVADGLQGLESARSFHPDVVCTDICMPGMSGAELCQALHRDPQTCCVPVLALTALSRESWDEFANVGFADIFEKPCEFESLSARIASARVQNARVTKPS